MLDPRITELLELAAGEGFVLVMTPEHIIALEDEGHIVNLRTGEIIIDGADQLFELTTAGEALVHVWNLLEVA